jgi:hypothetical protein
VQSATLTLPRGADLSAFLAIRKAGATPIYFDHEAVAGLVITVSVHDLTQLARIEAALRPSYPEFTVRLN